MSKTRVISQDIGDASVLPADLDVSADNTTADSTIGHHGLLPKLGGGSTNYLRADGTWAAPSGSGAPASVDYLVGTTDGGLSAEIVVGTTPGGELGGTWAAPTVDEVHAGATAWTNYTPTLTAVTTNPTLGSSTITGRYKALDAKTYIVRVDLAITTGGAWNPGSGEWKFGLPSVTGAGTLPCLGSVQVVDAGVGFFAGVCQVTSGQGVIWPVVVSDDTANRVMAHNKPVVWATGDRVMLEVIVETT